MKRRSLLRGAAAAGAAGLAASAFQAPAIAQGKRELKLVTSWPKNLPGLGTSAQWFADKVTAMSEGTLTVRLYAAGELVPPFGVFDAVSQGNADMYHAAAFLFAGKSKAFSFFSTVPFGLTSDELIGWYHYGGAQALYDEAYAPFKLKPFLVGVPDFTMMGWLNKEIRTLDDLKGLKYRMPGFGGEALRRLGVAVVNIPPGELLQALRSGAIDGTEWAGPYGDLGMGFHKAAKYYYYPGFHEPGTGVELVVNLDVWKSLKRSHQEIIRVASDAANLQCLGEFTAGNGEAIATLVKQGVQLRKMPDPILKELAGHSEAAMADFAKSDPMAKKVYDSLTSYRKKMLSWSPYGAEAYYAARRLALG